MGDRLEWVADDEERVSGRRIPIGAVLPVKAGRGLRHPESG